MTVKDLTCGIIGAGAMGEALMRGMLRQQLLHPSQVLAYDVRSDRMSELEQELSIRPVRSIDELVAQADLMILAVKPQHVSHVLEHVAVKVQPTQLVVSIAAGTTLAFIEERLGAGIPVIRVMPNTPALVGKGVCALSRGRHVSDEHETVVRTLLASVGSVVPIPESLMDAVTGLSGSGPAYICLVVEALADGGVAAGLPREVALNLAAQTVRGTGELICQALKDGEHPAVLRERVTSPAGTTAAGLATLEMAATRAAFAQAVGAATVRSKELGGA